MQGRNHGKSALLAAAVTLALGSSVGLAQQRAEERAENVESAERRLDNAEDRLERAEEEVEQRRDELGDARETGLDRRDADAAERRLGSSAAGAGGLDAIAAEHGNLSHFMAALQATGLAETLTSGIAYTVFAPTDDAFGDEWEDLQGAENREELIELLRAHIVADDVDAERARTLGQATTVDGGVVEISVEDGDLMIGDAKVVDEDISSGNLRVYAIDDVLDPDASAATAAVRDRRSGERDVD